MATLTSGWTGSVSVNLAITRKVWLKSIERPSLNARIPSADSAINRTSKKTRAVRAPLGRSKPIVLSSVEDGDSFTMNFTCVGAVFDQLMALLDSDTTLYIENESRQWYVRIAGDVHIEDFLLDGTEDQTYKVNVPFVEIDRPS